MSETDKRIYEAVKAIAFGENEKTADRLKAMEMLRGLDDGSDGEKLRRFDALVGMLTEIFEEK